MRKTHVERIGQSWHIGSNPGPLTFIITYITYFHLECHKHFHIKIFLNAWCRMAVK